jgi:predicted MFS family arabinose efflux permease
VAVSLARFSFTPILPVMLHEGKLDLQAGGVLASLHYLGYVLGALSCAAIRVRPALMIRGGLVVIAALLIGMGLLQGFVLWSVLRTAAGIVSGWVFVFASGWGLRRVAETGMPTLGGVIYIGPGIGIVVTGLLGGAIGRWGSDAGWIGFGLLALLLTALIWRIFGDGASAHAAPVGAGAGRSAPAGPVALRSDARWLVALYGIAGFGYIITATFLPVIARQALPGSPGLDFFWPLIGLAIIPGALIGARAPLHWDNRMLLAAGYTLQALGIVLSVAWPTIAGFALGSLLVGLPFTAITFLAMREARRLYGNASAGLMSYATASYGIGQILGPLFAAPLAQRSGSFTLPLLVAAGALALGALLFASVWWRSRRSGSVNVVT